MGELELGGVAFPLSREANRRVYPMHVAMLTFFALVVLAVPAMGLVLAADARRHRLITSLAAPCSAQKAPR